MEILLIGLGNPGPRYAFTRHNAGFLFLDYVAQGLGVSFQTKRAFEADYCEGSLGKNKEHRVHLLKPNTFMNVSGRSVAAFLRNSPLTPEQLLVIHDEVEIPMGDVRLKKGGGDAGHNGLKSLRESLGGGGFYRLRVGVGRPDNPHIDLAEHVLQKFPKTEEELLSKVLQACEEAVEIFLDAGLPKAQMRLSKI